MEGRRQAEAERAERERQRGEFLQLLSNDPVQQEGLQMLRDVLARAKQDDDRARLLRLSAAEAWMQEHPEDFNADTAPTLRAGLRLVRMERLRLKASRERLRGLGIK